MAGWTEKLNNAVAHSAVGKYFQLEGSGHRRERKNTKFTTELRAGLTIFFAMVIDKKSLFFFLTKPNFYFFFFFFFFP
jgi:hypothetical protein